MNKKRDLLAVIILLLGKYVIPYMIAFSLKYILRKDISSFQGQILDLAIVIITFVVIVILYKDRILCNIRDIFSKSFFRNIWILLSSTLIVLLANITISSLLINWGISSDNQEILVTELHNNYIIQFLSVVILAPVVEEAICRGVLFATPCMSRKAVAFLFFYLARLIAYAHYSTYILIWIIIILQSIIISSITSNCNFNKIP
jgi:membrane protease YdiL (CAAX protease family)